MTTLQFNGDLSLWLGLTAAFIVAVGSWFYYRRESHQLPHSLRWILPLLRSTAFLLGVLVLTGPALHHRKTTGELGQVRIYLDSSASMTMLDQHMSSGRKLLIAEKLGWIPPGTIETGLLTIADEWRGACETGHSQLGAITLPPDAADSPDNNEEPPPESEDGPVIDLGKLDQIRNSVHKTLSELTNQMPAPLQQQLMEQVLTPLESIPTDNPADAAKSVARLHELMAAATAVELELQNAFEQQIQESITAGDSTMETALALFDDTPRWQRAVAGLTGGIRDQEVDASSGVVNELRQAHDIRLFVLNGKEATERPATEWESLTPSDRVESQFSRITDLSTGVVKTGEVTSGTERGHGHQAIVLVTDGQHNSGPTPLQTARILGSQGIPFFVVSTGASREAQDLAVVDLEHPDLTFQKDRVRGVMVIRDKVTQGTQFVAEIRHGDTVLWREQLSAMNIPERRVEFDFSVDQVVEDLRQLQNTDVDAHMIPLELEASVSAAPNESELSNNQQSMRMAVMTDGYRLLILDGRSRWETRYLRNVFTRDEQWAVSSIVAGVGTDQPDLPRGEETGQFPSRRDLLFAYDLIILGEVDPNLFQPHELEWIRDFADVRGGGVIFVDGNRRRLEQLESTAVAGMLPVEWSADSLLTRPTGIQLTERGIQNPALKLSTDESDNEQFWTELPPPRRVTRVTALPGAEVLAEAVFASENHPLMVTRLFGAGRVLYFSSDESWRWRYKTADTWHQRFWNQIARYVMPRPFASSDDYVSVDTGAISYQSGESVDIRVRLLDLEGRPAVDASVEALLWKDGKVVSTVNLPADSQVPGIYRGRSAGLIEGNYEVTVRAAGYSESALKARGEFVVLPPDTGEMSQTGANEALLRQVADASGGKFLREEEIGSLPSLLSPFSGGRVEEGDTPLWDSYWWFAVILTLLTIEWGLRKRAGLL